MGEISISYLFQLAWHRIWALIMAAAVFAIACISYCEFLAIPVYSAQSSIIVTNGSFILGENSGKYTNDDYSDGTSSTDDKVVSGTDVSSSLTLANTVVEVISTNKFYDEVAQSINENSEFKKFNGGNEYTYQSIAGKITIARRTDKTLAIDITVKSSDQEETLALANAVSEYATDYVESYIPYSKTEVLDKARSSSKVFPMTAIYTIVAAVAGAALAFGVIFLIDALNQTVRGEEEFAAKYDIPLLGSVPDFQSSEVIGSYKVYGKSSDGGYK